MRTTLLHLSFLLWLTAAASVVPAAPLAPAPADTRELFLEEPGRPPALKPPPPKAEPAPGAPAAGPGLPPKPAGKADPEAGIRDVREQIRQDPGRLELYAILGRLLVDRGRQLEAIPAFEEFFRRGGRDPELYKLCGQIYTWNNRAVEGLPWFDKYLVERPHDADILKLAAQLRIWNDRQLEALPYLDRYLSHRTDDVETIKLAGRINLWNNRQLESLPYIERYLENRTDDVEMLKLAGQINLWNSRPAEADRYFRRLVDARPGDTEAVKLMGDLRLAQNRPLEAIPWYEKYLGMWPRDAKVQKLVCQLYAWNGQPERALNRLRRLGASGDRDLALLEARLLLTLGRREASRRAYERILERWPNPGDPAVRDIVSALLSDDPPFCDRVIARFRPKAAGAFGFFLDAARLRLFASLRYSGEVDLAVPPVVGGAETLKLKDDKALADLVYGLEALIAADRVAEAHRLAAAAFDRANGRAPVLAWMRERTALLAFGDRSALGRIRAIALANPALAEAALFYVERETDEIRAGDFFARLTGDAVKQDAYLYRRARFRLEHGDPKGAAGDAGRIAPGLWREKARLLIAPADPLPPREILYKYDVYDEEALGRMKSLLAGLPEAWAKLQADVARMKKEREAIQIGRLRAFAASYPEVPEAATQLARTLFWSESKTEAVALLDEFLVRHPDSDGVRAWRYRFVLPGLARIGDEDLRFLRRAFGAGLLEPVEFGGALVKAGREDEALALYESRPDLPEALRQAAQLRLKRKDYAACLERIADYERRHGSDRGLQFMRAEIASRRRNYPLAKAILSGIVVPPDAPDRRYYDYLTKTAGNESAPSYHVISDYSVDSEALSRRRRVAEFVVPYSQWAAIFGFETPLVDRSLGISSTLDLLRVGARYRNETDEGRASLVHMGFRDGGKIRPDLSYSRAGIGQVYLRYAPRTDTPEAIRDGIFDRTIGYQGDWKVGPLRLAAGYDALRVSDGNRGRTWDWNVGYSPWRRIPFSLVTSGGYADFDTTGLNTYYAPDRKSRRAYGTNLTVPGIDLYVAFRRNFESGANEGKSVYAVLPLRWKGFQINLDTSYSEAKSGRFNATRYHSRYFGVSFDDTF